MSIKGILAGCGCGCLCVYTAVFKIFLALTRLTFQPFLVGVVMYALNEYVAAIPSTCFSGLLVLYALEEYGYAL
jgi:hypothetical protein